MKFKRSFFENLSFSGYLEGHSESSGTGRYWMRLSMPKRDWETTLVEWKINFCRDKFIKGFQGYKMIENFVLNLQIISSQFKERDVSRIGEVNLFFFIKKSKTIWISTHLFKFKNKDWTLNSQCLCVTKLPLLTRRRVSEDQRDKGEGKQSFREDFNWWINMRCREGLFKRGNIKFLYIILNYHREIFSLIFLLTKPLNSTKTK